MVVVVVVAVAVVSTCSSPPGILAAVSTAAVVGRDQCDACLHASHRCPAGVVRSRPVVSVAANVVEAVPLPVVETAAFVAAAAAAVVLAANALEAVALAVVLSAVNALEAVAVAVLVSAVAWSKPSGLSLQLLLLPLLQLLLLLVLLQQAPWQARIVLAEEPRVVVVPRCHRGLRQMLLLVLLQVHLVETLCLDPHSEALVAIVAAPLPSDSICTSQNSDFLRIHKQADVQRKKRPKIASSQRKPKRYVRTYVRTGRKATWFKSCTYRFLSTCPQAYEHTYGCISTSSRTCFTICKAFPEFMLF